MMFEWLLVWIIITVHSSYGQQYYDSSLCSETAVYPGTRYTCNSSAPGFSCPTFLVYRASQEFQTISKISSLFNIPPGKLLFPRNNITSASDILKPGREILIPVQCSCSAGFFTTNFTYTVPENTMFDNIACEVFEGLVKSATLLEENLFKNNNNNDLKAGTELLVPLKCACPDKSFSPGLKYLVTYPLISGDDAGLLSQKFKIPVQEIWKLNHLSFQDNTVYPNTTILVPLESEPSINFSVSNSEPPSPGFLPTSPVEKPGRNMKLKKLYIAGSVIGFSLLFATLIACYLYLRTLKKFRAARVQSSIRTSFSMTPRSSLKSGASTNLSLSPDLLAGLKYSLCNYTVEELKKGTKNFGDDCKVSESVYKGWVDNSEVLIKQVKFEGTRQIIDVHSRLNHVNIVRLHGVCYGEENSSYLVFEFAANGSLREFLSSNPSTSLRWHKRTQIAFDIATSLHYLHYCTIPPYTHMNVNTKNIFLTQNWRAKLTVFAAVPAVNGASGSMGSLGGWIAPEHLVHGSVSEKADIFGFGVVLLELISGKCDADGGLLSDSITFLGGGASEGGCFEQLRNFMDPSLKEDYPLAEALCLAVLAKACVEDDPLHRPSMDDIIKILARMV